jgi:hypothetical protein
MSEFIEKSVAIGDNGQTFYPDYTSEFDDELALVHTRYLPRLGTLGILIDENIIPEIIQQEVKE